MKTKKLIRTIKKLPIYSLAIIISCLVAFPVYWMFTSSLQSSDSLFNIPPNLLPTVSPFFAYMHYLISSPFLTWTKNTIFIAAVATLASTAIAVLGAYGLSRFQFKGKVLFSFIVLLTQMLPTILIAIPLFVIFSKMGLVNTVYSLMAVDTIVTTPIGLWFLKGFFDSIPRELEDAARIDGCSRMAALIQIDLPLIVPGIVATATWVFIVIWDEYLYAVTLVNNDRSWVISVGIASYFGEYSTPWNDVMTGAALATLPILVLFLYFQKHLVSGLTAGSVKG